MFNFAILLIWSSLAVFTLISLFFIFSKLLSNERAMLCNIVLCLNYSLLIIIKFIRRFSNNWFKRKHICDCVLLVV